MAPDNWESSQSQAQRIAQIIKRLESLDDSIELQCNRWQASILEILNDLHTLT